MSADLPTSEKIDMSTETIVAGSEIPETLKIPLLDRFTFGHVDYNMLVDGVSRTFPVMTAKLYEDREGYKSEIEAHPPIAAYVLANGGFSDLSLSHAHVMVIPDLKLFSDEVQLAPELIEKNVVYTADPLVSRNGMQFLVRKNQDTPEVARMIAAVFYLIDLAPTSDDAFTDNDIFDEGSMWMDKLIKLIPHDTSFPTKNQKYCTKHYDDLQKHLDELENYVAELADSDAFFETFEFVSDWNMPQDVFDVLNVIAVQPEEFVQQ